METKTPTESKSLHEYFQSKLNSMHKEIEEMALQFSLGKADAKDKFEEVKKEFAANVHDLKREIDDISFFEVSEFLKNKIDELSLQLHLGKVETKELFDEQMAKIVHAVSELESRLKEENIVHEKITSFKSDLKKFLLKSEIVGLKFQIKSIELNDLFHKKMIDAKDCLSKIMIKFDSKKDHVKEQLSDFEDDIEIAFEHFKSAVKSLRKSI
ncbi:MAG: hypothetical protein IPH33_08060 [Bacteroidetes bacterium]|nr:hypothetical protein [Bacteroidota bacterium]